MINQNATLKINDMTCDDCVRRVAESLLGVEGVDDVEVELEERRVRVDLSEHEPAEESALVEAVRDAGFTVDQIQMP
jgi:copper chaperone CopZ